MRKTNRVLAAIAALVLALGLVAAFNTSASAAPSTTKTASAATNLSQAPAARLAARRKNFGAIHINVRDGRAGYSYDKASKKKAKKAARKMCRRNSTHPKGCKLAAWVRNGCAAVAIRVKKGRIVEAKSAIAFTKKKAVRKARKKVGRKVRKKPLVWVCTTRYR